MGDVVAFGDYGSITSKAVVYEISYDNIGKMTVTCYPYFDSLYTCAKDLPTYSHNLAKKEKDDSLPLGSVYSDYELSSLIQRNELNDFKDEVRDDIAKIHVEANPIYGAYIDCNAIKRSSEDVYVPNEINGYSYVRTVEDGEIVEADNDSYWSVDVWNDYDDTVYNYPVERGAHVTIDIKEMIKWLVAKYSLDVLVIKNLEIKGTISGTNSTGGVVGFAHTNTLIDNCHVTATVTGTAENVGGVVGVRSLLFFRSLAALFLMLSMNLLFMNVIILMNVGLNTKMDTLQKT